MSSLRQTEKIERTLFRTNSPEDKTAFEVNNTILLSAKSGDNKLDPLYINRYDSSKYENYGSLNTVKIATSDFITFNFMDYKDSSRSESVYISYPHLAELDEFVNALWEMVNSDIYFDKKNNVRKGKEEEFIESDSFGSDKIMWFFPTTVENEHSKERGVILCVNNEDAMVILDYRAVKSLYFALSDIDLLTISMISYLTALTGLGNSVNSDGEETAGVRPPRRGTKRKVAPARRGKVAKPKRAVKEEEDEDDEVDGEAEYEEDADETAFDIEEDEDDIEEEKPRKKTKTVKKSRTTSKKTSSSSKSSKSKKKTSMDAILEEAENMEYEEDEEDDIDFDDED